jgi:uncharacterized protein (DUF58 family)
MQDYLPFLVFLTILAALLQVDSVLVIFYLLVGTYLTARLWSLHSLDSIRFTRDLPTHAFHGETVQIHLHLTNSRWLPTLWLQIHESLPLALAAPNFFRQVFHLGAHENITFEYPVYALKRGFYTVGPLYLRTGDFLGLTNEVERQGTSDTITVYPKIFPISRIGLPTHTPFGNLKHHQPIYEDPSRVVGKREYHSGDSQRHIDWKTSAAAGSLMVKKYEPSISLETCIFLDLNPDSYDSKTHFDATELAIVVSASIASWIVSQKQAVGLATNAVDPLNEASASFRIPPRKGRGHLMHVLDKLARVQAGAGQTFSDLLNRETSTLPWGTTTLLITGRLDDSLFDQLIQIRRRGLDTAVILVGKAANLEQTRGKASHTGIEIYQVQYESDLEQWR